MPRTEKSYTRSSSTDWEWKLCKIAGPRPGKASTRSAAQGSTRRARRDERKPLHIEVAYRGGPEAMWILRARGHEWKLPGHRALHDALLDVNGPFWAITKPE